MDDSKKPIQITSRLSNDQKEKIKTKKITGKVRSESQKDFYSRARRAKAQTEVLKELIIANGWYTVEEIDDLLDSIKDPGSIRVQRQIKKLQGD